MGSPVFHAQILRAFFTVSHGSIDMTFFLARSAANEENCNHHSWDSFRWVVQGSRRNFHKGFESGKNPSLADPLGVLS